MMDQTEQFMDVVEEISEDEETVRIYCEGFSGKQEYKKGKLNQKIRDLFESCNVNFLIGSGYCYERLRTLGDLESLIGANVVTNKDNQNSKNAIEALILYDFFRNSIYPHKDDIETNCSIESSNIFILKLAGLLSSRNDKNLLKRVNIFTTNYDMFFELSLERNKIYYNDGFSGRLVPEFSTQNYNKIVKQIVQNTERESQIPTVNIYKLHGSLTWSKESDQIVYRSNSVEILKSIEEDANVFTDVNFMYDKSLETNINDSIDSINLSRVEFSSELLELINKFTEGYQQLNIINPTKKKFEETLFSNVYYDLLRMYSNELEKNNSVLFVFGFSFKDEHIHSITKRALSNPSMMMYIFVFDAREVESFKDMFKEYYNVFYIYCENRNIDLNEFTSMMFGG
ncbi:SIR2 family protein [Desulfosporosinus nitroreducens]|uniref:SIR2 family protein n=1 Tax=Desulfosporosinus nitroreducens TaxID=2018668 RepID=UPI00207D276A|nr:SIR2 family protein [Desulfosporosinus nitroreducens]MCO1600021.1 SIR2 family protein [Desulfosporosinus nitroreducens]